MSELVIIAYAVGKFNVRAAGTDYLKYTNVNKITI